MKTIFISLALAISPSLVSVCLYVNEALQISDSTYSSYTELQSNLNEFSVNLLPGWIPESAYSIKVSHHTNMREAWIMFDFLSDDKFYTDCMQLESKQVIRTKKRWARSLQGELYPDFVAEIVEKINRDDVNFYQCDDSFDYIVAVRQDKFRAFVWKFASWGSIEYSWEPKAEYTLNFNHGHQSRDRPKYKATLRNKSMHESEVNYSWTSTLSRDVFIHSHNYSIETWLYLYVQSNDNFSIHCQVDEDSPLLSLDSRAIRRRPKFVREIYAGLKNADPRWYAYRCNDYTYMFEFKGITPRKTLFYGFVPLSFWDRKIYMVRNLQQLSPGFSG